MLHYDADYGHFVAPLAEAVGWDRWVVAGHSLGGAIALTVAVYQPERLSGLILIDTGARLRVRPTILELACSAALAGSPRLAGDRSSFAPTTPQQVVD